MLFTNMTIRCCVVIMDLARKDVMCLMNTPAMLTLFLNQK